MTDDYAESAEFLDIMSRDAWRVLGPVLASLVPRLIDPEHGSVTLGGVDIRRLPADKLYAAVGFVFQQPYLLWMSMRDNIACPSSSSPADNASAYGSPWSSRRRPPSCSWTSRPRSSASPTN